MSNDAIIAFCREDVPQFGEFHLSAMIQVLEAVEQVIKNKVPGVLMEIGVYKGIMPMAMCMKMVQLGVTDREVHLYDTFNGMTEACDKDVDVNQTIGSKVWQSMCKSSLDRVRANVYLSGYPMDKIFFHVGDIRQTDVKKIPEKIAFLRLDTDFYDSTKFELEHFEPHVMKNGIVTIDDYGWWNGSTVACREYMSSQTMQVFNLHYMKPHGVWWIKE